MQHGYPRCARPVRARQMRKGHPTGIPPGSIFVRPGHQTEDLSTGTLAQLDSSRLQTFQGNFCAASTDGGSTVAFSCHNGTFDIADLHRNVSGFSIDPRLLVASPGPGAVGMHAIHAYTSSQPIPPRKREGFRATRLERSSRGAEACQLLDGSCRLQAKMSPDTAPRTSAVKPPRGAPARSCSPASASAHAAG